MALDEPKETDDVFEINGLKYLVNKDLLGKAKPIKVDFQQMGFKIDSSLEFGPSSGCDGCGTDTSCATS